MFEFQLAAKLGRTRQELLRSISSKELSEWMAYNELDPFTEDRADDRSAIIARVCAAGMLEGPHDMNDFRAVPEPVREMSLSEMGQVLRSMASLPRKE